MEDAGVTPDDIKSIDDPTAVTSTEFDILSNRIGALADLHTTNKTTIVAAVNENADAITNLGSRLEKHSVGFTISNISANGGGSAQVTLPTISGKTPVMVNIRLTGGYNLLTAWLQDWNTSSAEVRAWNGRTSTADCTGYVDVLYW